MIHVDSKGVLLQPPTQRFSVPAHVLDTYLPSGAASLIAQSNPFLFRSQHASRHNDSFASEYFHYFANRAAGDLHLTDPNAHLPSFEDASQHVQKAHARLFAIWLGVNKNLLFEHTSATAPNSQGFITVEEQRLFFTRPLFIISEVILTAYVFAIILLYFRRPGAYLSRMPTSLAAVITLFASSAAVMDFRGTSSMSNRERERYLADLDCRYGYGSFVGSDGAVHVGIEKVPFVQYVEDVGFKERVARRRKGSPGGNGKELRYAELDRSEDGDRRAREEAHKGGEERRGEEEGRSPSSLEDIPLAADDELC